MASRDILLADEINRGTTRKPEAFLEVMAEAQITLDGVTHKLSNNFVVVATQNSIKCEGRFPLLETQQDGFMPKIFLGYLDKDSELEVLTTKNIKQLTEKTA